MDHGQKSYDKRNRAERRQRNLMSTYFCYRAIKLGIRSFKIYMLMYHLGFEKEP